MTWARAKIYKKDLLTPRPCKKCGQWMSAETCQLNYNKKSINQKAALALKKQYGEPVGRPHSCNYDEVRKDRAAGMTFRELAAKHKTSNRTISRALETQTEKDGK